MPVEDELKPWETLGPNGKVVGKDPRTMAKGELEAIGHRDMSPLKALRLRCLDCCAGSDSEVRNCTARKCPSWPFRMGSSPWRRFKLTDAQRAHLARMNGGAEGDEGDQE